MMLAVDAGMMLAVDARSIPINDPIAL